MSKTVVKTTRESRGAVTRCTITTVVQGSKTTVVRKCTTVNTRKGKQR